MPKGSGRPSAPAPPLQAVVLDVVHRLQQPDRERRLQHPEQQRRPTSRRRPGRPATATLAAVHQGSGLRSQLLRRMRRALRLPAARRARQLPGQGARQEAPQAFARPGGRRVVVRGGAHMVAAVVLHHEVPIHHAPHQHPAEGAVASVPAVSQFVGEGDALRRRRRSRRRSASPRMVGRSACAAAAAARQQQQISSGTKPRRIQRQARLRPRAGWRASAATAPAPRRARSRPRPRPRPRRHAPDPAARSYSVSAGSSRPRQEAQVGHAPERHAPIEARPGGRVNARRDNPGMNPLLSRLQPYPFERLKQLSPASRPNPAYRPISLGIGEPKHPTPAFIKQALARRWTLPAATWPATRRPPASPHLRAGLRRLAAAPLRAGGGCRDAGAAGERLARGPVRVRADGDRPHRPADGGLPQSVLPDLRRRGPAGRAPSRTTRPATRRATSPSTGTACRRRPGPGRSCCSSARPATPRAR